MTTEEILSRYKDKRSEISEYMNMLVNSLSQKYGEIPESFVVSLDLLVFNLEVMFNAIDDMKQNGMTKTDKYHGEQKSSSMQAFFNAQNYIHKLIASFGFTPSSKSKIRENVEKGDVQKLLENLVS